MKQTRYKLTRFISWALVCILAVSLLIDVLNGTMNAFMYLEEVNIELSQMTIFLLGALVAKQGASWANYFATKQQEDHAEVVKSIMNGKNGQ